MSRAAGFGDGGAETKMSGATDVANQRRPLHRFGDRRTFLALRRGHRARRGPVTVTWVPAETPGPPRVAYAIGRQVGGATERNRLRRRLRAVVAAEASNLATGSYLVAATAEASSLGVEELQTIVKQAMQAAVTR